MKKNPKSPRGQAAALERMIVIGRVSIRRFHLPVTVLCAALTSASLIRGWGWAWNAALAGTVLSSVIGWLTARSRIGQWEERLLELRIRFAAERREGA